MSDKRKSDKKRLAVLEKSAVTISDFIKSYLGINDESLLRAELSHVSLSEIFPYLTRTNFKYILANPREVYNGNIVLVVDSLGNYAPYDVIKLKEMLCDPSINQIMDETYSTDVNPESWDVSEEIDYDLSTLSTYELVELMYSYKKANEMSSYYRVRKELVRRENSARKNRQNKQKVLRRDAKRTKVKEDY